MRVFVTGTDTNVGKTLVSAWLCRHFGCDYFKPVQAGLLPMTDREWVQRYADCHTHPEAYRLREPASPHYAARLEGRELVLNEIHLPAAQRLVVEGAGGVMVPLAAGSLMIDLIAHLQLPVLLVASTKLGTLNHTLLTLQALRQREIAVLGVVLNGPQCDMTAQSITDFGNVPVLQHIPVLADGVSGGVSAAALMQVAPTAALRRALGTAG